MCKACEMAKIITNRCYENNYSVSAAKLQKLLVLMYGECLSRYNEPLFPENVVCWKCGVAIKEVELKFILHNFAQKEYLPQNIAVLQYEEIVIDKVLSQCGQADVVEINSVPRLRILVDSFSYTPDSKIIIPNEAIKKVFFIYDKK